MILLLAVSLFSSIIGAITGIGGGIIIKPVVDLLRVMPVSSISFLSGCTVLSMAFVSVLRGGGGDFKIDKTKMPSLASGAAIGGILGKILFDIIKKSFQNDNPLGLTQSLILCALTIAVLFYILNKNRIKTHQINNKIVVLSAGFMLGLVSSFLGIGGGPFNLVLLSFLFSMDTKTASRNSLFIILFSQAANLLFALINRSVPQFELSHLILMASGGVCGGIIGSEILKRISIKGADRIYLLLLILIICICVFNATMFAIKGGV